jgi:hypothetical protein
VAGRQAQDPSKGWNPLSKRPCAPAFGLAHVPARRGIIAAGRDNVLWSLAPVPPAGAPFLSSLLRYRTDTLNDPQDLPSSTRYRPNTFVDCLEADEFAEVSVRYLVLLGQTNSVRYRAERESAYFAEMMQAVAKRAMVKWVQKDPENERAFWVSIYPKLLPVQREEQNPVRGDITFTWKPPAPSPETLSPMPVSRGE